MLSLVAKYLPKALPLLGKVFKGKATKIGDALVVAGAVAGVGAGPVFTDQNIVQVLHELGLIVVALGGVISAFGFGRKSADAAARE